MYKIGEFSKITDLTVKTLRYYDEENILTPNSRQNNGYRLYNEENYKKALFIKELRSFNFNISEVKEILENCEDNDDFQFYLHEKKELLEKKIKEDRKLIKKINLSLNDEREKGGIIMDYKIERKKYNDIFVICKRLRGSIKDSGDIIPNMYKRAKMDVAGPMTTLYYEMEASEKMDIEICVPVNKDVSNKEYRYHKIEGVDCLMTVHVGKYEDLKYAYKALFDYANENNIKLDLPIREMCIKGPGAVFKGNPNKYVTEIAIPIKRGE